MSKVEIAEAECPSCSPDEPTTHVIIKEGGLVKCEECGYVHAVPVKKKKIIRIRVIVSRQQESSAQEIELSEDDVIHVGDEFVVEHDDEVSGVKIQSIELKTKGRPEEAVAKDIDALWARAIDDVIVKIAVQKGAITESINHKVNGDFEFTVGDTLNLQGYEAVITSIKEREGRHNKRKGQVSKAKDIKRIYSRSLTSAFRFGGRTGGFKKTAPTERAARFHKPGATEKAGGFKKSAAAEKTGRSRPRSTGAGVRRKSGGKR